MTAFRLVDLEESNVADILRQMERFQPIGHAILNKTGVIQVGSMETEIVARSNENSLTKVCSRFG